MNGNTIIPIDELESLLHPDLIKHLLLIFLMNSKNSQLLCTTHHRELLMGKDISSLAMAKRNPGIFHS